MTDNQILNLECQYDFPGCDKRALGLFNGKWSCGRCILKIENRLREKAKKEFEIIENELRE